MTAGLLDTVRRTIREYDMIKESERLLVGLSGGADSAALLLCLHKLGYAVEACHVNHNLRGAESDRDQVFCQELCERLGIRLYVRSVDVTGYCRTHSVSVEEGARKLRYEALESIDCDKLCTAHNLDDCLETTLFNLARGTGLKGLSSIPPVRGKIIRPLIQCSREAIEEFLAEEGQTFVTDSTNLQDEYSRNKLRHRVVPVLKQINPSLLKTFGSTVEYLRCDSELLESMADELYESARSEDGLDSAILAAAPFSVKRRAIMRFLRENGLRQSYELVEAVEKLADQGSGRVNVGTGLYAEIRKGRLRAYSDTNEVGARTRVLLTVGEPVEYKGRQISAKIIEEFGNNENVHKKFANLCFDYDKIKGELVVRERTEGDRIRLVNREHSSDVRKLLKESLPREKRSYAVIVYDDEGAVFVEGYGCADRVKIDGGTRKILVLSYT